MVELPPPEPAAEVRPAETTTSPIVKDDILDNGFLGSAGTGGGFLDLDSERRNNSPRARAGDQSAKDFFTQSLDGVFGSALSDRPSSFSRNLHSDPHNLQQWVPKNTGPNMILATDGQGGDDLRGLQRMRQEVAKQKEQWSRPNPVDFVTAETRPTNQAEEQALINADRGIPGLSEYLGTFVDQVQQKLKDQSPEVQQKYLKRLVPYLEKKLVDKISTSGTDKAVALEILQNQFPGTDPRQIKKQTPTTIAAQIIDHISEKGVLKDNAELLARTSVESARERAEALKDVMTTARRDVPSMDANERRAYISQTVMPEIEARFKGLSIAEAQNVRSIYNEVTHAKSIQGNSAYLTPNFGINSEGDLQADMHELITPDGSSKADWQRNAEEYASLLINGFNAEEYADVLHERLDGITRGRETSNEEWESADGFFEKNMAAGGIAYEHGTSPRKMGKALAGSIGTPFHDQQGFILGILDGLDAQKLAAVELAYEDTHLGTGEQGGLANALTHIIRTERPETLRERLEQELDDKHDKQLKEIFSNPKRVSTQVLPRVLYDRSVQHENPFNRVAQINKIFRNADAVKAFMSNARAGVNYADFASGSVGPEKSPYRTQEIQKQNALKLAKFLGRQTDSKRDIILRELGGTEGFVKAARTVFGSEASSVVLSAYGVSEPATILTDLSKAAVPVPGETKTAKSERAKVLHRLLIGKNNLESHVDLDDNGVIEDTEPTLRSLLESELKLVYGKEYDLVSTYEAAGATKVGTHTTTGNYYLDYRTTYPELDEAHPNHEALEIVRDIYGDDAVEHLDKLNDQVAEPLKQKIDELNASYESKMEAAKSESQRDKVRARMQKEMNSLQPGGKAYREIVSEYATEFQGTRPNGTRFSLSKDAIVSCYEQSAY